MLFKILLLGALGYFFTRLVFKPKTLSDNQRAKIQKKEPTSNNDEYVDYEEIE